MSKTDRILSVLLIFHYRLINFFIYVLAGILFKKVTHIRRVKKILLLRQGGIGDTIVALPAILSLRKYFNDAQIDLLTHQYNLNTVSVPALVPPGIFHDIYKYDKFVDKALKQKLKANNYDLYIELPSDKASVFFELRSILLAKNIGAKNGIGWQVSSTTIFRELQEKLLHFDNERERLLKILKSYLPHLQLPQNYFSEEIGNFLLSGNKYELNNSAQNLVALAISAGEEKKIWLLDNFIKVAKHFTEKGFSIIILGGKKDFEAAEKMNKTVAVTNLCGELDILETAGVLKKCRLLIGNDTGIIHLAYSVGLPVLGIYGGKGYSNRWEPPKSPHNKAIRNTSLQQITAAQVLEQVENLLGISEKTPQVSAETSDSNLTKG